MKNSVPESELEFILETVHNICVCVCVCVCVCRERQ